MKKLVLCLTVVVFLVGLVACGGGGEYAEAKEVMEDMIGAFDGFGTAMEKANDAKAVAAALNDFLAKMEDLKPKMDELEKKYPNLKNEPPEELKDLMPKMDEAGKKMMGAMMKIGQYAADPEVAKAMEKLQKMR